jgi:type IV secretion system protein VirD4
LLNLFFQQLLDLNTRELPNQNKEIKYECLLLMDEFTSIGKIGILSKGISYIASYRLRMMPIIQSPAQLVSVYGKDAAQTFTTNHALNIIYPPKASETQTARDISEWLGYQTVKSKSESKNKYLFSSRKNASENLSDQRRALLLPQEITSLGRNKEMVIMENVPPILARKILYYKDLTFINRLQKISPRLNSIGKRIPTREQLDSAILSGELKAHVPMIDLKGYQRLISSNDRSITVEVPQKNSITVERPVTPADAPKLAKLGLASFKVDFSAVEKPKTGEMDETALFAYADILSELAGVKM